MNLDHYHDRLDHLHVQHHDDDNEYHYRQIQCCSCQQVLVLCKLKISKGCLKLDLDLI